jgi:membrane protein
VLGRPAVAAIVRVLDRYNAAGGGLLAAGLAYGALFAIVPGLLLLAGVVGLIFPDPAQQAKVVAFVSGVLPPIRDLIVAVLSEAARGAAPVSLVGAVILVWGTSRFAVSFQDAIGRVMGDERRRGVLARNLGALGAVALMVAVAVGSTLVGGLIDFLRAGAQGGELRLVGDAALLVLELFPVVAAVGAVALVYRVVPIPHPAWRAVRTPAIGVGVALAVLARVFVFVAPRLIGAAALIGTLATAFVALAWLGLSFQALLLGAAWVRDRAVRTKVAGARPTEG